jgi:hypothetical protein
MEMFKITKLKWLGHVARDGDDTPNKKIALSQLKSTGKKGILKIRWLDYINIKIQNL